MVRFFPYVWLLSFAAALLPLAAYEGQFFLVSFLVLALGVIFTTLKHPLTQHVPPMIWAFLMPAFAFWGLAFASVIFSQVHYISFIYFCFFSAFPLSLCCTLLAQDKRKFFTVAGAGAAILMAALSAFSIVEFFALPDWLVFGRSHYPFADPNSLAGLLSLGFFGAFGLMIAGRDRLQHNAGLLLSMLLLGGIFTSGSRGAFFALIVALALFVALARPQVGRHKRSLLILFVAAAGLLVVTQFFGAPAAESVGFRVAQTARGEVPMLWTRPDIWASTFKIIRAHPWTGTGIGTFYLYYPEVRGVDYTSAGRMAHSDPLQFWAEMGVLAPVLFYLFIGLAVAMTMRALKVLPREDDRRVHILAPFCALGAMVLHTHITFHFYVLSILMAAGVLIGYWLWRVEEAAGSEFEDMPVLRLPGAEVLKVVLIVPLLLVSYVFLMLQGSQIVFERGDMRGRMDDLTGFVRDVNHADIMAQHKNDRAIIMAAQIKQSALEAQGGMPAPDAQQTYEDAMDLLRQAEALNPRNVMIPYVRGQLAWNAALLRLTHEGDEESFLKQALTMDPLYYPARVDLAKLYRRHHEGQKSYETLYDGWIWYRAAVVPQEYYQMLAVAALEENHRDVHTYALRRLMEEVQQDKGNSAKIK